MEIYCLLSLILFDGLAMCAEIERPELVPLLHVGFDGDLSAVAYNADVTVTGGEGLEFVEGKVGQATSFGDGDCVEYHNIPALNPESCTIEFWVKPDFDEYDLEDHYFLRLLRTDESSSLDINFAQEYCGFQAAMTVGEKTANAHADFQFTGHEWNHVAITWDMLDPEIGSLRVYMNGRIRAYLRRSSIPFKTIPVPDSLRIGCKSPDEGVFAKALIDDIYIYNRCLTELQVLALYDNAERGADKVELVRDRLARDDATKRERMETLRNERNIAMAVGRTISGWSDGLFELLGFPTPDKIDENDFETADLAQYDVLIFPGGAHYMMNEAGQERLREYVRNGGGYVGICAGQVAAKKFGLIEREYFPFWESGMVQVTLKPHPITDGFNLGRKLELHHVNGRFMEAGDESEVPVMYKAGPPYACAVAKQYGEGRVVVFSAHPESGDETRPLTRNAILWAAKVIGTDDEGEHNN